MNEETFFDRAMKAGMHPVQTLSNLPITEPTKLTPEQYSQIEGGRKITLGIKGKKLHMGCGFLHIQGFLNIDKHIEVEPDRIIDIEQGLPFPDNYFDQIHSFHVIEHIRPEFFDFVLEEMHRVCKPGAIIDIGVPFDNISNRTDYDHYRTFSFHSFDHAIFENKRTYYKKFIINILNPKPNKVVRWFYYLFPLLKKDLYFKMEVVKNG